MIALNEQAPTILRANSLKPQQNTLIEELKHENVESFQVPGLKTRYSWKKRKCFLTSAFKDGFLKYKMLVHKNWRISRCKTWNACSRMLVLELAEKPSPCCFDGKQRANHRHGYSRLEISRTENVEQKKSGSSQHRNQRNYR